MADIKSLQHEQQHSKTLLQKLDLHRRTQSSMEQSNAESQQRKTIQTPVHPFRQPKPPPNNKQSVDDVYRETKDFIANLDNSILKCRRFNEVKTYRKYEVIMKDMELEIGRLKDKLQMEEQMRSPTKAYVGEILDKLVQYREENSRLQRELLEAKEVIISQADEIAKQKQGIMKLHNTLRTRIQKLPPVNISTSSTNGNQTNSINTHHTVSAVDHKPKQLQQLRLDKAAQEYLAAKTQHNKKYGLVESRLQAMLRQEKEHMWDWDLSKLLLRIDNWVEEIVSEISGNVEMWKLRLGLGKKLSEQLEQSQRKKSIQMSNNQGSTVGGSLLGRLHSDRAESKKRGSQSPRNAGGEKSLFFGDLGTSDATPIKPYWLDSFVRTSKTPRAAV